MRLSTMDRYTKTPPVALKQAIALRLSSDTAAERRFGR